MAYPNALPAGLLSFVYHAVYNQQVIVDLRAERIDDVLAAFELNTPEQKAVKAALAPGQVDEPLLQNIANLMAPYVVKAYNDILEEIKTKEEDSDLNLTFRAVDEDTLQKVVNLRAAPLVSG